MTNLLLAVLAGLLWVKIVGDREKGGFDSLPSMADVLIWGIIGGAIFYLLALAASLLLGKFLV